MPQTPNIPANSRQIDLFGQLLPLVTTLGQQALGTQSMYAEDIALVARYLQNPNRLSASDRSRIEALTSQWQDDSELWGMVLAESLQGPATNTNAGDAGVGTDADAGSDAGADASDGRGNTAD